MAKTKILDKKEVNDNKITFNDIMRKIFSLSTSRVLVIGFALIVLLGALLLMSPMALSDGQNLNLLDAIFIATSAISTSGLSPVSVPETFSPIGYTILMCIIEVGGVGFMVFVCWAYKVLGKKLPLKSQVAFEESFDFTAADGKSMISKIISFMFISELIGMIPLAIRFIPDLGVAKGLFYSIFHSISAFCNAGFSLFDDSLMTYENSLLVNVPIMCLIIIGGLGYPVVFDICKKIKYTIKNKFSFKKLFRKFNLQTKITIVTSLILIIVGTVLIFAFEYTGNSMQDLNFGEKLLAALFHSVGCRSTGFNTIDIVSLRSITSIVLIVLMFIGSGPASTGGGIRVVPFAILAVSSWEMINNEDKTIIHGRHINEETIKKSMVVFFLALMMCIIFTLVIVGFEDCDFLEGLFEVVSAFSTTGFTLGLTPTLGVVSKIVITLTMFIGRVGIITVLMSISAGKPKKYTSQMIYPEEKLILG